jgi:sn-glycerol 3-phosphate transport system substrate-binding protein
MAGKIFISYRRDDAPGDARGIHESLSRVFGKSNVFMDIDNLLAGQRFDKELEKALEQCDVLIAVVGPHWIELLSSRAQSGERDYVREEIAAALKCGIVVVPVLAGRQGRMPVLPRRDELPEDIRDLVQHQKLDVTHERFRRDAAELVAAIKIVLRRNRRRSPWTLGSAVAVAALVVGATVFALQSERVDFGGTRRDAAMDTKRQHDPEPAQNAVKLSFWYPEKADGPFAKAVDGLIVDFNKTHPDIRVTASYIANYRIMLQTLQAAKSGGILPDVAVSDIGTVSVLAALGAAQPLDELIANSGGKLWLDRFWPSMLLNCVYNGKIYAIPFSRSTPGMYYNKDAFAESGLDPEKPPLTWEELVSDARKLTRRQSDGTTRWGIELPASDWFYYALTFANGGETLSADGTKVLWDQPSNLEALQFWYDLVNTYKVAPADPTNGLRDFADGKAAMLWESVADYGFIQAPFRWGLGRIPKHSQFGPPSGGGNLQMYATDPVHREAAWTFITWISDTPQAARWSVATGYPASTIAAWEQPEMQALLKERPGFLVLKDQIRDAKRRPDSAKYSSARDILNALIKNVLANRAPLEPATRQAVESANAALAR